jgi:hypothetical protein
MSRRPLAALRVLSPPRVNRRWAAVIVLLVTMSAFPARADEIIDRVLAVANGDVILLSDVRLARTLRLVPETGAADPDRAVLGALIDRALMLDEVDRYAPPEPSASEIDLAFAEIRDRVGTLPALNTVLSAAGMDERQLRELLRHNLRIRSYLTQRFAGDTPERTQTAIGDWVLGLRRRADIVDTADDVPTR